VEGKELPRWRVPWLRRKLGTGTNRLLEQDNAARCHC